MLKNALAQHERVVDYADHAGIILCIFCIKNFLQQKSSSTGGEGRRGGVVKIIYSFSLKITLAYFFKKLYISSSFSLQTQRI